MGNLTEPVAVSLRHWAEGAEPVAAWWSQEGPGGPGGWSSEGCQLRSSQPHVSSLQCQHLGNVAVLMVRVAGTGVEGRGMQKGRRRGVTRGTLSAWGHRNPEKTGLIGPRDGQDSQGNKWPSGLPHTSSSFRRQAGPLALYQVIPIIAAPEQKKKRDVLPLLPY